MAVGNCKKIYRALRDSQVPLVPVECVEPLLLWLCGSQSNDSGEVYRYLGSPFDDSRLVLRVYQALDSALFRDNELLPHAGSREQRETRFRLLALAYHPDRYPEHADWLGSRAMSVNASFDTFRKHLDAGADMPTLSESTEKTHSTWPASGERQVSPSPENRIGLYERLISLHAPLSRSRFLLQKILVLTAILCALPVLYLYHAYQPLPVDPLVSSIESLAEEGADVSTIDEDNIGTPVLDEDISAALEVLERFRRSFESGELEALLELVAPEARVNANSGRTWLRRNYGDLFEQTLFRSLDLEFSSRQSQVSSVRLDGHYRMKLVYHNGRETDDDGDVVYRLVAEDGDWKISAIDFLTGE